MQTLRTARKEHQCTLCALPIPAGERYTYKRITPWDHPDNEDFFDYRAHDACNDAWQGGIGADWCWVFPYGEENEFRREARERNPNVPYPFGTGSWVPAELRT